jgi:hypothetical protein
MDVSVRRGQATAHGEESSSQVFLSNSCRAVWTYPLVKGRSVAGSDRRNPVTKLQHQQAVYRGVDSRIGGGDTVRRTLNSRKRSPYMQRAR